MPVIIITRALSSHAARIPTAIENTELTLLVLSCSQPMRPRLKLSCDMTNNGKFWNETLPGYEVKFVKLSDYTDIR